MNGNVLDLAVIGLYLAGVAAIGIALRGRQEGMGDYFLGNRSVPWPLILLSIVATETSSVTFLSVPGVSYGGDMTFLQLPIGYIVGRLGVAIFLMPQFFRGEQMTLYETFGRRFGRNVQQLNSVMFIMTRSVADGLRLFLTALVVHELTSWDFAFSVATVGVATIAYTFLGGIRAVIWTDFVQFFVYMIGAVVAGLIMIERVPGGFSGLIDAGGVARKFAMLDFGFDATKPYTFWAGLVGGGFLSAATHGADQMMVQRYLCTNSVSHARLALVSSGFVVLFQFAIFLVLGVGLYCFYQTEPPQVRNDEVFVRFIVDELPPGVRGLTVAAVFSAAMSTLSSSLNAVASAAVADLYQPLVRPKATPNHYLGVSRYLTVAAGLVQMAVALAGQLLPADSPTVNNVLTVASFVTGITLGVLLLGVLVPRAGQSAAITGMLVGATAVLLVWLKAQSWLGGSVAWPWFSLIGSLSTLTVGTVAAWFAPRECS